MRPTLAGRFRGGGLESGGMNKKLDVGGTLSQIFSTYGEQAGVLLPVAFVIYLVVAVVDAILADSVVLSITLGLAVSVIAGTLYQGMVVTLVKDIQDGRRDYSVQDLIDAAWPVVLPLIGAGILAGIAIGIGFFLLLVPGLFLLTIWAVIAPVIVVERSGVIDAFGRSRQLVKGNGWQVFGVIFCVFLITLVVAGILGAIGGAISGGFFIHLLFSLIASTLTAPIVALAASTIYFGLLAVGGGSPVAATPPEPAMPPPVADVPPAPDVPPPPPNPEAPPPPPAV
jgi:hypothetical protein